MADTLQGRIESVTTVQQGGITTGGLSAGMLPVANSADFDRDGGTMTIDGADGVFTYDGVVESLDGDDVLLCSFADPMPGGVALGADVRLDIYPAAWDTTAEVQVVGDDVEDTVRAVVPHALKALLVDGIREDGTQEWVDLVQQGTDWVIQDIIGQLASVSVDVVSGLDDRLAAIPRVIASPDAPDDPVEGDTWFHEDANGNVVGVQKYTGGQWVDQPFTGAALAAGSVTTAQLAAGAVTADTIAADALVGKTIEGADIYTPAANMIPRVHLGQSIMEVVRSDGDGNEMTTVSLGGPDSDQLMLFDQTSGDPLAGFDTFGNGVAQTFAVNGDVTFQGGSLTDLVAAQPQGIVAAYALPTQATQAGSSELGFAEIAWTATPGHLYKVTFNGYVSIPKNNRAELFMRACSGANGGSAAAPTLTNTVIWNSGIYAGPPDADGLMRCHLEHLATTTYTLPTEYRVLFSLQNLTANAPVQASSSGASTSWIFVEDMGSLYSSDFTDGQQTSGGGNPYSGTLVATPTNVRKTYTTTWNASWARSWQGGTLRTDVLGQGTYNGKSWYAMAGFTGGAVSGETGRTPTAALTGSQISGMWLALTNTLWASSPGTVRVGHHGNTTAPSSPQTSGGGAFSSGSWVQGATRRVPLPSSWWSNFATGADRGITLGEGATTFGKFATSPVQLIATYTR